MYRGPRRIPSRPPRITSRDPRDAQYGARLRGAGVGGRIRYSARGRRELQMGDRRTGEWVQGDAQERRARLARQAPLIDRVARETPRRRKRTTKSDALEEAGVLLKRVVAILFALSIVAAFAGPAIA